MTDEGRRTVRGEVLVPLDAPTELAELVVQVEDVSRADAPTVVVGEQRQQGVTLEGGAVLLFEIEIPADLVDPSHTYSVRVHGDASGSGQVEVGDLVSTQSHPVLTHGFRDEAAVPVTLV
jgi:putative lipoprotein